MKLLNNLTMLLFVALFIGCSQKQEDYTQYVNPFIGTLHEGHCFPGATTPMGMIQVSPESTTEYDISYANDHVAGYQYKDEFLAGFTQTHINGAGCPTMSDILLMPYCNREIDRDSLNSESFISKYNKESEVASPGYYSVYLTDNNVTVDLTATPHVAYHKYEFNSKESVSLLVDLQYGVAWDKETLKRHILDANDEVGEYSISGYRKPSAWAARDQYYTIKFNKKIAGVEKLKAYYPEEKAPRYILKFDMEGDNTLEVQVAISTTSVEAAKNNLESEVASFNIFNSVHSQAKSSWNGILSRVELEGDKDKKIVFYTGMYHMYIQPNNIADVDGKFRAASGEVFNSRSGKFYTTLSLWDTYRATHPLYTLLTPSLVPSINASIMDHYAHKVVNPENANEANRFLPRWALWGQETNTMIGNHAVPVLVDAWLKGLKPEGYTDNEVFDAIWESVTKEHYRNHVQLIDKYGYIPYDAKLSPIDDSRETVSRLLEGAYDDYCAAVMADKLGLKEQKEFLEKRAENYKNVYDKKSGFMLGRNAKGEFKSKLETARVVGEWVKESDYTEGNSYHYLFHVQHNIEGLRKLMGEETFVNKLDTMFYAFKEQPYVKGQDGWKIYGLLGNYWHGNEPCHHVPYLYKFTDKGYKTDAIIRYLVDHFSLNAPDGLKGNDDCGQMSAWYIFASMGFYPVNPCSDEFVLGAPQMEKISIKLENGNKFTVIANGISNDNIFVESVTLNGKPIENNIITYSQIMNGGELVFNMASRDDREELQKFKLSSFDRN